jgi:hypothetical protein
MLKDNLKITKMFKSEDSKFYLKTGFKFLGVSIINSLIVYFLFWTVIELNKTFFLSQGYSGTEEFKLAYFDFVFKFIIDKISWILGFSVFVFFSGIYTASLLIRPFKSISSHCASLRDDSSIIYGPSKLSDFKVLQSFAELFFSSLRKSVKEEKVPCVKIPDEFKQIREFNSNKVFLFNFMLFFSIICFICTWFYAASANEIHSSTLELAFKLLPANKTEIFFYLNNSRDVWYNIVVASSVITIGTYFLLARHLYTLVSGASLGYFLTMRSFLKGNFNARVHLVGYNYVRLYARHFNKYLDHFCRELKIKIKKE